MKTFYDPVSFVSSAARFDQCPKLLSHDGKPVPELALAGRSNVGKSSLLNLLFKQKHLVKVSRTPGKTQLLNFFLVEKRLCFVDMPGFGFAKVAKSKQKAWAQNIEAYLSSRESLQLILYLVDARRELNDQDHQALSYLGAQGHTVFFVLTKGDKIPKTRRWVLTRKFAKFFSCDPSLCFLTSTLERWGVEELIRAIETHLSAR